MRAIYITIDTTVGYVRITDADGDTGHVNLDYAGPTGRDITIERVTALELTDAAASIRFVTPHGKTGAFTVTDIESINIDAVVQVDPADLDAFIALVGEHLFASGGGGNPVTITDTDSSVYEVEPGGTFECTIPSALATFNFAVANQKKSFHRMGFAGTVTGVTLDNVADGNYSIWKNKVLITPLVFPIAIAQGDRLDFSVTPTNAAANASIALTVSGIGSALTFNSLSYHYAQSTIFTENVNFVTDKYLHTDMCVKGKGNVVAQRTNCIFGDPLTGAFEVIGDVIRENTGASQNWYAMGLNDQSGSNTPATRIARQRYMIRSNTSAIQVYEAGTLMASVAFNNSEMWHVRIKSTLTSPGVYTITYSYSTDDKATWTLIYTSLVTYNGTTPLHADLIVNFGYYGEHQPPQLVQQ